MADVVAVVFEAAAVRGEVDLGADDAARLDRTLNGTMAVAVQLADGRDP